MTNKKLNIIENRQKELQEEIKRLDDLKIKVIKRQYFQCENKTCWVF